MGADLWLQVPASYSIVNMLPRGRLPTASAVPEPIGQIGGKAKVPGDVPAAGLRCLPAVNAGLGFLLGLRALAFGQAYRHEAGHLSLQCVQTQPEQGLKLPKPLSEGVSMDEEFLACP